ncbi:phenylacetate--CoA ligase family protein [Desulfuromonas acetoxidans]|uniref:CapK protein n=1 Tax=Desulfuromonas acetoxidans (strain DSM 684 / 11070) TaxID=281689 RepID=Q1K407_DESA6|nr:phenylacetate--CoA ligase family protein [Desulfuromonas acetoxidans]EAT17296.1 putative CapK protein [Desulfuromonas acetoxidans DSM 684]MBF0646170.1 phenylacetate--CoA ligase family protein [Desulfuromonas acetoxidans]NVD26240.1 phenylacetate--CoA ligase family protein [Desulfuromonas acetoxidans]NVE15113.1 phenylacetate--CoA ligase family protein [Desulfuromonas acetoxidans]
MIPIIARQIFKMQEQLLGRESFSILGQLLQSEYWGRERLRHLQLERFQRIVQLAYQHTPYWRTLMDQRGLYPQTIQSLKDLQRFPFLNKEIIRNQRETMVWKDEGKRVQLVRTSGSTNEALEFYTSSTREAQINAARMRGHEWVGMQRGEKELYYWGSPVELSKQDRIKQVRDWLINDALTNGFEVTPERLKSYFAQWLTWRPKCIFGYPSTFVLTVTMAQSLGLDLTELKSSGLAMIITTSELLSDIDRELIEQGFGVPVYDSYGLREAGLIGHECSYGTMHCMDEQLFLETIDPQTLQPTEGEGELVVTNLVGPAFPMIRYRTGDIVTLSQKPCACGRTLSSVSISGGRAVEFIVTKAGKWVVGYSFIYIARAVKGIVKFQVVQEEIGAIHIRLVTNDQFPADGIEQVRAKATQRLGGDDRIEVELVDEIKPARSGKYRPVISKVAEELYLKRQF